MRKFSLRQLIVVTSVCALLGGLYVYSQRTPLIGLFGSRRNLEIIRTPTKMELYRLGTPKAGLPTGPAPKLSPLDYPIVAGPKKLAPMVAAFLGPHLASEASYHWDYPQLCDQPVYEIKLCVYKGGEQIDLYLSFT